MQLFIDNKQGFIIYRQKRIKATQKEQQIKE